MDSFHSGDIVTLMAWDQLIDFIDLRHLDDDLTNNLENFWLIRAPVLSFACSPSKGIVISHTNHANDKQNYIIMEFFFTF